MAKLMKSPADVASMSDGEVLGARQWGASVTIDQARAQLIHEARGCPPPFAGAVWNGREFVRSTLSHRAAAFLQLMRSRWSYTRQDGRRGVGACWTEADWAGFTDAHEICQLYDELEAAGHIQRFERPGTYGHSETVLTLP